MDDLNLIEIVGYVKVAFIVRPDVMRVYQSGRKNYISAIYQGDFFPSFTTKIWTQLKEAKHAKLTPCLKDKNFISLLCYGKLS
jgi:hypothetical protein